MSLLLLRGGPRDKLREGAGWLLCGGLVLAVHGGALAYMLREPPTFAAEEPAAVMIELAEMPVAPEAEPTEAPIAQPMDYAPPKVEEEVPPDPLSEELEDTPPPEPVPEEEPIPEVAESPAPDIEVPLPPPPPLAAELTPPEKKPEPPKERPEPKPKPKPKEQEKSEKPPQPRTSAAASLQAAPSNRIAAPSAGSASSSSLTPANWRSRLMGHLNRHKRYPPGESGSGKARVAFSINRSGQVLGARLVGSSGNAALDAEAVAMVRRASPVPPPPPEVPGSSISFTVPVDFNRR